MFKHSGVGMESIIRKWGNSPALRLNVSIMKAAAFDLEQRVSIKATKGRIVIEPITKLDYNLADLVAAISAENRHDEVSFGPAVGNEVL